MRSECPACKHPFAWYEPRTRVKRQSTFLKLDPIVPYCSHCNAELRYIRPIHTEWAFRATVAVWAMWFTVDVLNLTRIKLALGYWPHSIIGFLLLVTVFSKGRYESA